MNKFKVIYIDILCFIIGPFLIAYNLFDFDIWLPRIIGDQSAYYYYYKQSTQILIAVGVALVCWGFLRQYWEKKNGTRAS